MSPRKKEIYSKLAGSTFGHISFAAFFIAIISGVILAVFYNVSDAYNSISLIGLANPAGHFIRSLHYWSGQVFLVFLILHIWDHLRKSTEKKVKTGVWLRLTISILAVSFVMLSGFILKTDLDALQAKRILQTLLTDIPLLGDLLAFSFLGTDEDLQLVYLHHVATMSIFIWIIIIEHVKLVWPQLRSVLYFLLPMMLLSLFFPATLQSPGEIIMKGPWYFLGLQEILHYLSSPIWVIVFSLFLLVMFYMLKKFGPDYSKWLKKILLVLVVLYSFFIIIGYFFRGENWEFVWPWNNNYFSEQNYNPVNNFDSYITGFDPEKKILLINGSPEGCIYCHDNIQGFSSAHNPEAIGCASCHLGNTNVLQKELAHNGMDKIPGNLDRAAQTCGRADCHPGIADRVNNSIMNTMSGVVSVNRFAFGESDSLDKLQNIKNIRRSAADSHLRNLCASCHTGKIKMKYGPINELSRGGGCNACHLNYDRNSLQQLALLESVKSDTMQIKYHPALNVNVTDDHCFGCHSRSGRISTNYQGWHETTLEESQMPADSLYRLLQDGRVFKFVSDDVHHQRGMECIDCHNSYELMGDGNFYAHQEEQVRIQCQDCHSQEFKNTKTYDQLDVESLKITRLRGFDDNNRVFLTTAKDNIPLINTKYQQDGKAILYGKNSAKTYQLNPPAEICRRGNAHDRLTCNACHSSWAPQCIGCHTEYSPSEKGIDHLTGKETGGRWVEYIGEYLAEKPTLGIIFDKENPKEPDAERIETFIPGMVLTIDKSAFTGVEGDSVFKRLFAPTIAHTTSLKGRSCKSCHNNPVALGYGRGKLEYSTSGGIGKWTFLPLYQLLQDSLPADAWIGFMDSTKQGQTTRTNTRAFTVDEQQKILRVGACLTCHTEESKIVLRTLGDFDGIIRRISEKCTLPF